ncbi:hypothetical protein RJ640_008554 [Escallonia rubra]|uniref:Histidine-containing phosphotransfer protein n=1 Tax=Escallonia rubra TaxID=112253 RepID=A0AA88U5C6_9ASTE|nr:hypothetical protein RJ640_008554 [Escallonia rubra]
MPASNADTDVEIMNSFTQPSLNSCHISSAMERNQLHRQLANMRKSLFDQGFLDEQFIQLEELQDDANPNFVEEVVTLYYRDSTRLILNIEQALDKSPLDLTKLDSLMHQFKGSSSSIGAKKVKLECTQFKEYCKAANGEGCKRTFLQVKKEYGTLKKKLEAYFQMARQVGPVETACRPK